MSTSLKTIQTLFKVGKIIAKVLYILSIVGLVLSILATITLYFGFVDPVVIGDTKIYGLMSKVDTQDVTDAFYTMIKCIAYCLGQLIIYRIAVNCCNNELLASNPFTFEGADELKKLGISFIVVPIITNVVIAVIQGISVGVFGATNSNFLTLDLSLGMGIAFIILSVVCRYGAEVYQVKDTIIHDANLD